MSSWTTCENQSRDIWITNKRFYYFLQWVSKRQGYNTQNVHNGYWSYFSSANLCDSGSPSSLETVPPFHKWTELQQNRSTFPVYVQERNRPVITEFECVLNPKCALCIKDVIRKYCVWRLELEYQCPCCEKQSEPSGQHPGGSHMWLSAWDRLKNKDNARWAFQRVVYRNIILPLFAEI